jgi:hypothetical protein
MKTYSIHVTQLDENDKELCYFDELSLFISKIVKSMKMFNVKMINISDYYAESYEDLETKIDQIIGLIISTASKDKDCQFDNGIILTITVDISPIEFPPDIICTEEIATEIEKSLLEKIEIMKKLGFIKLDENLFEDINSFHFIYGNKVGKYLVDLIEESIDNMHKIEEDD